jgi:hypothetical protein
MRATLNTHETVCPAFKGSLMIKVDAEIVVAACALWVRNV